MRPIDGDVPGSCYIGANGHVYMVCANVDGRRQLVDLTVGRVLAEFGPPWSSVEGGQISGGLFGFMSWFFEKSVPDSTATGLRKTLGTMLKP